jgi:hypothetical protein
LPCAPVQASRMPWQLWMLGIMKQASWTTFALEVASQTIFPVRDHSPGNPQECACTPQFPFQVEALGHRSHIWKGQGPCSRDVPQGVYSTIANAHALYAA